jgi:nicotinate-nucleotide pyrophosphorylase (carboxylating)
MYTEEHAQCAETLIQLALREDLLGVGDITTQALVGETETGTVQVVVRQPGVLCGMPIARRVFEVVDPRVQFRLQIHDGTAVRRGDIAGEISGPLRSLLTGERTALNFLTHLSGIATLTRQYADAISGTRAKVYDTRKTHPGWRLLEKYAVLCGGGANHRIGLYDMVLIKDNHLAGWRAADPARTLAEAVRTARASAPPGTPVEIEIDRVEQLRDALAGEPDMVLLDNMSLDQLRECVTLRDQLAPRVQLEASGGVNLQTIGAIARTGVERISSGALTHSAVALDLAFDWKP